MKNNLYLIKPELNVCYENCFKILDELKRTAIVDRYQ